MRLKWLSEAKLKARNEASRHKIQFFIYDAKLRFPILASLRSAIICKIVMDNQLVTFPARVKNGNKLIKNNKILSNPK